MHSNRGFQFYLTILLIGACLGLGWVVKDSLDRHYQCNAAHYPVAEFLAQYIGEGS